jgi:hypothetical protein
LLEPLTRPATIQLARQELRPLVGVPGITITSKEPRAVIRPQITIYSLQTLSGFCGVAFVLFMAVEYYATVILNAVDNYSRGPEIE